MPILSSENLHEGRRYRLVSWESMSVRVYDDARTALLLVQLFEDENADIATRYEVATRLLFVNRDAVFSNVKDVAGLLLKALKDISGLTTADNATSKPVLDWDADAQYIRASVQMTYGVSFDELVRQVDYAELCNMIALCPHETPIGQALYYRTAKPPKATKHNHQEREDFRRRQKFWSLKPKTSHRRTTKKVDRYAEMNRQATFAALALKRAGEVSK